MSQRTSPPERHADTRDDSGRVARIFVCVGGGRAPEILLPKMLSYDIVIIADVPTEIEQSRSCMHPEP